MVEYRNIHDEPEFSAARRAAERINSEYQQLNISVEDQEKMQRLVVHAFIQGLTFQHREVIYGDYRLINSANLPTFRQKIYYYLAQRRGELFPERRT